jgi:acetyl esterase
MSSPTDARLPAGLDPELARALARNDEIVASLGPAAPGVGGAREHFLASRAWWNEGGPQLAVDRDEVIALSPQRQLKVALYAAQASKSLRPAYVYLHGGGFRLGAPRTSDRQLRELALAWGGIVVSLDYAHMPEAVFPTAVEETAAALRWLHANGAQWGIDPGQLAFGGSSAGANVAMGAAVHLGLAASGFLKAGVFVVGVFDDDLQTASMQEHGAGSLLPSRESARALFPAYAGAPGQRVDPRFNARLANLDCMPPLFLAAADVDVYRDSSVQLARAVKAAGRSAEVKVYGGMTHLFWGYGRMVDAANACTRDMAGFLAEQLPVGGRADAAVST